MIRAGLMSSVLLFAAWVGDADARAFKHWSYQELLEQSDVVAVVEPLGTEETKDRYTNNPNKWPADHFTGFNTTFKIHTLFKGSVTPNTPLVLLHFGYSKKVPVIANGAYFVQFDSGTYVETPAWLAFLKQRKDGRYEPITGFYDAGQSFCELSYYGRIPAKKQPQ